MKRTTGTNNSNPTYPKRSYLWIVTLALFGIRPRYQWYNGFRPLPNDSLLFRIKLQTPEGRFSFSRDTTAGQVICIQIDTKNDSSNNVKIYGIYFEAGPDEPLRNNMNLRRAIIYTGDTGYRSYFVADSFDKDSTSAQGRLARQRLTRIQQELEKRKEKHILAEWLHGNHGYYWP